MATSRNLRFSEAYGQSIANAHNHGDDPPERTLRRDRTAEEEQ